jgi:hypothetical protein
VDTGGPLVGAADTVGAGDVVGPTRSPPWRSMSLGLTLGIDCVGVSVVGERVWTSVADTGGSALSVVVE